MSVSTIVVTAGSATANSYATLAVANQYHIDRPPAGTTWADASALADKTLVNSGLLLATKLLDKLVIWEGWRVDTTQALEWPRSGLLNPNGTSLSTTAIPLDLQHATAEFARHLIASQGFGDSALDRYGLTELDLPGVKLKFSGESPAASVVPYAVMQLLSDDWGYLKNNMTMELQRA